jgi:hypothetical protein
LSRADVFKFAANLADTPEAALELFVVSGVWGYGGVGYGAYRLRCGLDSPSAGHQLGRAIGLLRKEGPERALALLSAEHPRYLGIVFATKLLYFAGAGHAGGAIILDRLVSQWLFEKTGLRVPADRWDIASYGTYRRLISTWADSLGMTPPDVEQLVFQLAAVGTQWEGPP